MIEMFAIVISWMIWIWVKYQIIKSQFVDIKCDFLVAIWYSANILDIFSIINEFDHKYIFYNCIRLFVSIYVI